MTLLLFSVRMEARKKALYRGRLWAVCEGRNVLLQKKSCQVKGGMGKMLGLQRGTVKLYPHEKEWETEAQNTIFRLKKILGSVAKDIQHVGSTSILSIQAKPIIDIAVAVDNFDDILALEKELKEDGFYYRPNAQASIQNQLLFACGNYYDGSGDLQTHFIHVVRTNSMDWRNYINFRDYLNKMPSVAKKYEKLKLSLAAQTPVDNGREKYTQGKHGFIVDILRKALVNSYLGKTVEIKIDRPLGSAHPEDANLIYPVNYGYLPGVFSGDGEELDVYLLGVDTPVKEFQARVIGIIHRHNDVEDKLVAAPEGVNYTAIEIKKAVHFQEQYYESEVEAVFEKSCGTILYTKLNGMVFYLLIQSCNGKNCGFPKGHMEEGENEVETALRETWEETSIRAKIVDGFRREITYAMENGKIKSVVYFLANYEGQVPEHNSGYEHHAYCMLPFDEAYSKLSFDNMRRLLEEADEFLDKIS